MRYTLTFNLVNLAIVERLVLTLEGDFDYHPYGLHYECTFISEANDVYIHLHNAVRNGIIVAYTEAQEED